MSVRQEEIIKAEEEVHRKYHRRLFYILAIIMMLLFGSASFYYYIEEWRYLDALYFSTTTMTTIGYGDFAPKTDLGKMFTILFAFSGVGIVLYGLSLMASHFVEVREEFWLEKLAKINMPSRTVFGKLKGLFSYNPKKIVDGYNKYNGKRRP